MTEDKVVEDFLEMFPNCPNPEHQPKVVEHLVKVFKHVYKRNEVVAIDNEGSEDE